MSIKVSVVRNLNFSLPFTRPIPGHPSIDQRRRRKRYFLPPSNIVRLEKKIPPPVHIRPDRVARTRHERTHFCDPDVGVGVSDTDTDTEMQTFFAFADVQSMADPPPPVGGR